MAYGNKINEECVTRANTLDPDANLVVFENINIIFCGFKVIFKGFWMKMKGVLPSGCWQQFIYRTTFNLPETYSLTGHITWWNVLLLMNWLNMIVKLKKFCCRIINDKSFCFKSPRAMWVVNVEYLRKLALSRDRRD